MENSNKNKDKNNDSKKFWISSIILLVIIIALAIVSYLIYSNNGEKENELVLPYTELIQNINNNTVEKIELTTGSTTVKVKLKDEEKEKILFSADGFGKFGTLDTKEDWDCEARRYYFNIVGKYGLQVQTLLKKVMNLDIEKICPLHGPILNENLVHYIEKYNRKDNNHER